MKEYSFNVGDEVFFDSLVCINFEVDSNIASNPYIVETLQENPEAFVIEDDFYFLYVEHHVFAHFMHMVYIHADGDVNVIFNHINPYVDDEGVNIHQQVCYLTEF